MAKEKKQFAKPTDEEKLVFGDHHRFISKEPREKKKHRHAKKSSKKKQIRDLERFLSRENLPEEIKKAKKKELKQLVTTQVKKVNAYKKQKEYNDIRFIELKKAKRRMNKLEKDLSSETD